MLLHSVVVMAELDALTMFSSLSSSKSRCRFNSYSWSSIMEDSLLSDPNPTAANTAADGNMSCCITLHHSTMVTIEPNTPIASSSSALSKSSCRSSSLPLQLSLQLLQSILHREGWFVVRPQRNRCVRGRKEHLLSSREPGR